MTSGSSSTLCSTTNKSSACCHCSPFSQALIAALYDMANGRSPALCAKLCPGCTASSAPSPAYRKMTIGPGSWYGIYVSWSDRSSWGPQIWHVEAATDNCVKRQPNRQRLLPATNDPGARWHRYLSPISVQNSSVSRLVCLCVRFHLFRFWVCKEKDKEGMMGTR